MYREYFRADDTFSANYSPSFKYYIKNIINCNKLNKQFLSIVTINNYDYFKNIIDNILYFKFYNIYIFNFFSKLITS